MHGSAQRHLIFCLQQVYKRSEGDEARAAAAKDAISEGERILRDSAGAMRAAADAKTEGDVRTAAAWSKLVLADMAVDHEQDIKKAIAILATFDQEFAEEKDLIRLMLEKRIGALVKVNQIEDAVRESSTMMRNYPDAAAPVIDQVVTTLDQQIEELNRKIGASLVERDKALMLAEMKEKAEAGVTLAELLRNWSRTQKYTEEQLLPFELIFVKTLRMSGRAKDAVAISEGLLKQFPDTAPVISNAADALFALGDPDSLRKAAPLYDKIITRVRPEGNVYPTIWWNAWLRRLQINGKLEQGVEEITLRVRELESRDKNLGGEQFRNDFKILENKHAAALLRSK